MGIQDEDHKAPSACVHAPRFFSSHRTGCRNELYASHGPTHGDMAGAIRSIKWMESGKLGAGAGSSFVLAVGGLACRQYEANGSSAGWLCSL